MEVSVSSGVRTPGSLPSGSWSHHRARKTGPILRVASIIQSMESGERRLTIQALVHSLHDSLPKHAVDLEHPRMRRR